MLEDILSGLVENIVNHQSRRWAMDGSSMTLNDLISFETNFCTPPELQKVYKCLVLMKLNQDQPRTIDHHQHFTRAAKLVEDLPSNQKNVLFDICDSILTLEIAKAKNTEEVLMWLHESYIIKYKKNDHISSLNLGYINFTNFMYKSLSQLRSQTTKEGICSAFSYLKKAQSLELNVNMLVSIIGDIAISYIESNNGFFNAKKLKDSRKIQKSYAILRLLKDIYIDDGLLKERCQQTYKYLGTMEDEIINDSDSNPNANTDSDPSNIKYIKPNRVVKINPPFIANITNKFQVCVYKAKLDSNFDVAVKFYKPNTSNEDFSRITQEILIYQKLGMLASPKNCFLKYYGTFVESGNTVNMVMDYYPDNLMKYMTYLKRINFVFTEELIAPLYCKLINSFAEMETLGIYHGDIKPQNMLVDDQWNIKIIDFNCSLVKNEELTELATGSNPIQGTAGYRAPEIEEQFIQGAKSAHYRVGKADVFSLGMVFLQMILLCPIIGLNTRDKNPELIQLVETVPFPWAKELLKCMLDVNPKRRKKFKDLNSLMVEVEKTILNSNLPND
jgi:Protein kinase domain